MLVAPTVPAHFSQTANSCTGTLAANNNAPGGADECTVTVAFAPSSAGAKSGSLEVGSVTGGTGTAALTGTALTAATLTMTPATHSYGLVQVGQTGVRDFTVTNTGQTASGPLAGPALTGTNPTQFDINAGGAPANACTAGMALAAAASCVVRVTFSPDAAAAAAGCCSATIGVTPSSGAGGTASATLAGEATNLSISPESSPVLAPNGEQVFTITNNGTTMPSAIVTSGLSGGDAAHFSIPANTCSVGTVLNAGASCTVTVRFTPMAIGTRIAVLTVSGPPGYSTQATVSGTS